MDLQVRLGGPVHPVYVALSQGRVVLLRVAAPDDAAAVAELHGRCGPRTLHDRYLGPAPRLTQGTLAALLSPPGGCALVAETARGEVVAVAQVSARGAAPVADLAVLVRDDHQRLGLGTALLRHAAGVAASLGYQELVASGSADNPRLVRLLLTLGLGPYARVADGLLTVRAPLDVVPLHEEARGPGRQDPARLRRAVGPAA